MYSLYKKLILISALFLLVKTKNIFAQQQDKELAKEYALQAELTLAQTKAEDIARDLMVTAADYDTTFIKANFEAGRLYMATVEKELAVKYFLRVFRQAPEYRFDIEYWIGWSYQLGLQFDKAITYYTLYKIKLSNKSNYLRKDRIKMKDIDRRILECNNGKELVAKPKPYFIINMGREINSEFEDYAPVLNASEDEIMFTTRRQNGNTNENVADDNKPYEDVFTSRKKGDNWEYAKNIGTPINTRFFDSNLAFSPNGNMLFIYKDEGLGDVYYTERQPDSSWCEIKALPGLINSSYRESSVSITKDGKLIYFASERPGGLGGSDIYACTKDSNGGWSNVKNLGPTINTEYDEDGPYIDLTGKILYFSSTGRNGMGGFDIFKSTLLNDKNNEWSEPENMGYPINTPDNDVFISGTNAADRWYYSSVRKDGLGYSDIYMIAPAQDGVKLPTTITNVLESVKPKVGNQKSDTNSQLPGKPGQMPIKYIVKVVDGESKNPLDAKVRIQSLKDKVMVLAQKKEDGLIEFILPSPTNEDYCLWVEKEGYVLQKILVNVPNPTPKGDTITNIVEMKKLMMGIELILRNIYFDFNKATLKADSYNELSNIERMMRQNTHLQLEIAGHTDSVGDDLFNQVLSERRANAVKFFLTSKGIDAQRIKTIGYGETKPLSTNSHELEGYQLNRRVEFKVFIN